MTTRPSLFLIGYGFIGGTLLTDLLAADTYDITVLSRNKPHFDKLKSLGVKRIIEGDFLAHEIIAKNVAEHDITIECSFCDEKRVVEAILDGLRRRSADQKPAIFIHTSGTNELTVDDPSVVFSDAEPEKVDALDDSRPHRWVDVLLYKAIKSGEYKDKARMAIVMPPLVYGIGTGPAKRDTYQVPNLIRLALKHGYAGFVDSGEGRQTNIHVSDLSRAFLVVLDQLKRERDSGTQSDNLYYFPEHGVDKVHVWKELARRIAALLQARGKIQTGPEDIRSFSKEVMEQDMNGEVWARAVWSKNSMSKGDRIRSLGWEPKEKDDVYGWLERELDYVLELDGKK